MSQLRRRAKTVRAEGAARRRNWDPRSDSFHYQLYHWWREQTGYQTKQENCCHYLRAALLYAPTYWLGSKLAFLVRPLAYLALTVLATSSLVAASYGVWEFFQAPGGFWYKFGKVVLVLLGLAWFVLGAWVAGAVLVPFIPDSTAPPRKPLPPRTKLQYAVGVLLTLPIFVFVAALLTVLSSLAWVAEKRFLPRAFAWLCAAHFTSSKRFGWFRFGYLFPAALVGLAWFYRWALVGVCIMLGSLAIVAVILWLLSRADQHQQRLKVEREAARELAERARLDCLLRTKFAILHPRKAEHSERAEEYYQAWLQRYRRYVERQFGTTAFEMEYIHLMFIDQRYVRYTKRQAAQAAPQRGRLNRLAHAVLSGLNIALNMVMDLLSLVWSAIVVKKWGICPLVELPTHLEG